MAIYRLSAQVISRSAGRSATAAAAYRSASKILDERTGEVFDYSRKAVDHTEILAPENAPAWVQDRERLWSEVELAEKRKDAQVAREIQVALPVELGKQEQLELVREFATREYVDRGMVADIAIHREDENNPHAHIMLTMREVGPDGFGPKAREWNDRGLLMEWREQWAQQTNKALERAGELVRIDHRSYLDQKLRLEPQTHVGVSAQKFPFERRELVRERFEEHQQIARRNGEAIREDPTIALDAITHQRATFSKSDVARFLNTRTADAEQFRDCLGRVMGSKDLVELEADSRGRARYTTKEMLATEKSLVDTAGRMAEREGHQVQNRFVDQAAASRKMGDDQKAAFDHLVKDSGDVAVVQGYAGAGKSYMLGAAREAWEAQGFSVRGGALAGKAAEGLEISAGIESRSLHSWEYAWDRGRDQLGPKDVLVIDEAGMVGSRQLERVFSRAEQAGAKVVLVGDTEQLQAIEAGAPMRAVGERVGQVVISDIRRQEAGWQRQATVDLANQRTTEALDAYQARGHVRAHEARSEALDAMVASWDAYRRSEPQKSQIMLAYRRDEVRELNERARSIRRDAGELGPDHQVATEKGVFCFAAGDRVYFLRNDRGLGVKNGTLGTVEGFSGEVMQVRLDGEGGRRVAVSLEEYNHLDHGYAATVHKAQGVTVDRAQALAGDLYDRHVTYVAMSRHRDQVDLHWSREQFGDEEGLKATLGRAREKDLAIDYDQAVSEARQTAEAIERRAEEGRDGPGSGPEVGVEPRVEAGGGTRDRGRGRGAVFAPEPGDRRDRGREDGREDGVAREAGQAQRQGVGGLEAGGQAAPGSDREVAAPGGGPGGARGGQLERASVEGGGLDQAGDRAARGQGAQGVDLEGVVDGARDDVGRGDPGGDAVFVVDQPGQAVPADAPDRGRPAERVREAGQGGPEAAGGLDEARRPEREPDSPARAQPEGPEPAADARGDKPKAEEAQKRTTLAERLQAQREARAEERAAAAREQGKGTSKGKPSLKERLQAQREARAKGRAAAAREQGKGTSKRKPSLKERLQAQREKRAKERAQDRERGEKDKGKEQAQEQGKGMEKTRDFDLER